MCTLAGRGPRGETECQQNIWYDERWQYPGQSCQRLLIPRCYKRRVIDDKLAKLRRRRRGESQAGGEDEGS